MNSDSILDSVKKLVGIDSEYTVFDVDIIMHINTALSVLHQVGASPEAGLEILDNTTTWSDLIQDKQNVNMVKTYIVLKVRLLFDPPSTSFAIAAMEKQASELEWRLNQLEDVFKPVPATT